VLPEADVIVNPNQPGCGFESKALAGVGVMFYVLLATRAELRARGAFDAAGAAAAGRAARPGGPGHGGRRGQARRQQPPPGGAGPQAHPRRAHAAGCGGAVRRRRRDAARAAAFDFGFALGPRINAAGRLADMTLGIECLLTDDAARAAELAQQLDAINRERREVEAGMREQAEALLARCSPPAPAAGRRRRRRWRCSTPTSTKGVVGIVAGRLKDRLHRPTFVFARGADGLLKGSGRSIPGFHLRDALDLVAKRHPGAAAALRRPCDGRRLHLAEPASPPSTPPCSRWPPNGWTPPR
jgi:single-stranded-DNA-specific exonuclease